ncbi:MAG: cytochrome ubiquinol oxidase subunit I [Acidimicrobiia bacterium]
MSTESLHRLQFAFTVSYHFLFPPISLGLGLMLIIFGAQSVRTRDPKWRQLSMFWTKIYGLVFAMGIATGIVQEFEFGTNWSRYSVYVGNVFGSLLAAEGIFAFMLEGGFLGLMLFGGSRLGNRMWLFATCMVVGGATFSATWIVMANSWMQTPAGYELRNTATGPRAFMQSFSEIVFTPSFTMHLAHTLVAAWMVGAALVMSVAAWYHLKNRDTDLSRTMLRVSLPVFTVLAVAQVALVGANQAVAVTNQQPAKLAAMEGLYETRSCAPLFIVGWTDPEKRTTTGIAIPCGLSLLAKQDPDAVITGLNDVPRDEWPPVNATFQAYHLMIGIGMLLAAVGVAATALWAFKRTLFRARWMMRILVNTIALALTATIVGWWTAELGRQPWIVWKLLRTSDATSPNISTTEVALSLTMFVLLYAVLSWVFFRLLDARLRAGFPPPQTEDSVTSLPDSFGAIFTRQSRISSEEV